MREIKYKCGCTTHFDEKDGIYHVDLHDLCVFHAIESFHLKYYKSLVWAGGTKWLGHDIMKTPMDMVIIQEIIFDTQPDVIIETGTFHGGSALFMATILDSIGKGIIYTIENEEKEDVTLPKHERIKYLKGNSVSDGIVNQIKSEVNGVKSVMVCLDSDHNKDNVLKEMDMYSPLVSVGNYLIVDDTNINYIINVTDGYGKRLYEKGPREAVVEFLKTHYEFDIDMSKEKFMLTFNPCGYLRRVCA
jgi:cephalosporin hydroxylase